MDNQRLYPEGLKSMMECISRATLLSQPTDIHEFLLKYMTELVSFKSSQPETDPTVVSLNYQKFWEKNLLKNRKESAEATVFMTETSAGSPQVSSLAQVKEAQKMLYKDLYKNVASSKATTVVAKVHNHRESLKKMLGKDKKPFAAHIYPLPLPRTGITFKRTEPSPFLTISGLGMPAPPPCNDSIKTRRVALVKFSTELQRKETTDDDRKTQETPLPVCPHPPILKKSLMPSNASGLKPRVASKSSKLPSAPLKIRTHELILPDIPQTTTRGSRGSVNEGKASSKSREQSTKKREVGSEKTSSKEGKDKVKPETAKVQSPERIKEPGKPETASTMAESAKAKVEKLEKNKIRPKSSPAKIRGLRPLLTDRARVKIVLDVPVEGIQGRAFGRPATEAQSTNNMATNSCPNHTFAHLAHPVDIIRYRRKQLRSS